MWSQCGSCGQARTMPVRETRQVRGLRAVLHGARPVVERSAVCVLCTASAGALVVSLIPQPRRPVAQPGVEAVGPRVQRQPLPG
jgi:hypothetical protein